MTTIKDLYDKLMELHIIATTLDDHKNINELIDNDYDSFYVTPVASFNYYLTVIMQHILNVQAKIVKEKTLQKIVNTFWILVETTINKENVPKNPFEYFSNEYLALSLEHIKILHKQAEKKTIKSKQRTYKCFKIENGTITEEPTDEWRKSY
jgi:hypothetical protein